MLKRRFGTCLVEEGFVTEARLQMEVIADTTAGARSRISHIAVNARMLTDERPFLNL